MVCWATDSPSEALSWVRQGETFDVALLDMQLPAMTGVALAAAIHRELQMAGRPDAPLPVVLLTSGPVGAETQSADVSAVLAKPIKPSHLFDVLASLFVLEAVTQPGRDETLKPEFDAGMGSRLPLRILLAEDNAINQQVALSFLERLGYRADVAANGLEVLGALRRQPYDVVLMDVQMPEMDGLEATRRIRQLPAFELAAGTQPRIIAMTANAMREDYDNCLAAGMDEYISKPVQVEDLVRALSRCQPRLAEAVPSRLPAAAGPSPEPASEPVQDPKALARMRATLGRQAGRLLPGLIQGFCQDGERLLAQARQALDEGQPEELRRAAHSLKSSSATFGALALTAVARELELAARDGILDGAAQRIARCEAEFGRARAALEATHHDEP
jgi:CheY-like chemotaxis protein/HPt (histidine-containing phosphotransfer) domain-containing protein